MDQMGDDEEFLTEMLGEFIGECATQKNHIENALRVDDFVKVARGAHAIKGSAANLFCLQLMETSTALEHAAKIGEDNLL